MLVNACVASARLLRSTKIMPEPRECPLCGTTMRIRESRSVVYVPGNPNATTRTTREWVCPECDYFEEVEE
jgi:YgiT-type zinc finger domain-containing protein